MKKFQIEKKVEAKKHEGTPAQQVFSLQTLTPSSHQSEILKHWCKQLLLSQEPPKEKLSQLFMFAPIPGHLLHKFACDCAQKAVHSLTLQGKSPKPAYKKLLHLKEEWIEGKASTESLVYIQEQATQVDSEAFLMLTASSQQQVERGILYAASLDAQEAARYTSKTLTSFCPEEWQCQYLYHQLETYRILRARLIQLLHQRQKQIEAQLAFWKKDCEEGLFVA